MTPGTPASSYYNSVMQKLPASRGLAWLAGSLALLRSQMARLLLIGLVLQFLMGFTQAGVLGIAFVLVIPALSAGVLQAMFSVEQGVGKRRDRSDRGDELADTAQVLNRQFSPPNGSAFSGVRQSAEQLRNA